MADKKGNKPFRGALTTPIYTHAWWMRELYADTDPQGVAEYEAFDQSLIAEQINEKLHLLLDHFDIPRDAPDAWRSLSLCLASRFVSGFTIAPSHAERKAGKPKAWSYERLARLYVEVQEIVRKGKTARNACQILLKEERWRKPDCGTLNALYRRYQESKNSPLVKSWLGNITDQAEWEEAAKLLLREIDEHGQKILVPKLARAFIRTTP